MPTGKCRVCGSATTSAECACYGAELCEDCYIGRRPGTKVDLPREARALENAVIRNAKKILSDAKVIGQ